MAIAKHEDIERWIAFGKVKGATHVISVCDTFSHCDYPVYVMPGENLDDKKSKYNRKDMQKINEVISLMEV